VQWHVPSSFTWRRRFALVNSNFIFIDDNKLGKEIAMKIRLIKKSLRAFEMKAVIIYGAAPSGNSQKAILGCTLLDIPHELRVVANLIGKEAETSGEFAFCVKHFIV
jgi:hypothetical protein